MENIQWLSMFVCIISLVLLVDLFRHRSDIKYYLIPVLIYVISVIIFYSTRLLEIHSELLDFPDELMVFTTWSSILRLQALLTIFIYAMILGNYDRKIEKFVREKWKNLQYYWKN